MPAPPPPIPMAVPSQLLERRPDIAANERLVAAANANVGIARDGILSDADALRERGSPYHQSGESVQLRQPQWSAGPALSQTLFDFGRRALGGERAAAYDATVAAYRQTVLSAFQEVEDDLATLRYLAEEAVQQQDAVTAAQQALTLEIDRYKAGTDSYLNVITTQIIALNDQHTAITILQRRMSAAVDLVKALAAVGMRRRYPQGRCAFVPRPWPIRKIQ